MVLTVDVGNTNIVLGGFEGEELLLVSRMQTNKYKMMDEYAIEFKAILEFNGYSPQLFDGAIISSVVPPLLPTLKRAVAKLLGCRVLTVSPGTKTGLNICIDNPAETGADLVCGCVGAIRRYPLPCIVVDLGTATKFLVIDRDGNFLGGPILPGVNISLDALSRNTAQLPHIEFDQIDHVIGTNSIDCMRAGILYGTASMVDGMIGRIEEELGEPVTAVMTGGIAQGIVPYCKKEIVFDENLVLYGLKEIYNRNAKPPVSKIPKA